MKTPDTSSASTLSVNYLPEIVLNTFKKLNQEQNRTIILITHEQDIAEHANRIIHFKDGLIISDKPNNPKII
jgi:ABC-type lipoprotein export system ATPase subunit